MATRRASFSQAELTRILKAFQNAGVAVGRIEVSRDGKVVVYSAEHQTEDVNNPWDEQ